MKKVMVKIAWDDRSGEGEAHSTHDDKNSIREAAMKAVSVAYQQAMGARPPQLAKEEPKKPEPAPPKPADIKKKVE